MTSCRESGPDPARPTHEVVGCSHLDGVGAFLWNERRDPGTSGEGAVLTASKGAFPDVAFVTMRPWGRAYPRIARWLGAGLREIGAAADIVYLDGPPAVARNGSVSEIQLGIGSARWGLPKLARYLAQRRPAITLATPGGIGLLALVAGQAAGQAVVPWEATIPRLDARDVPRRVRGYSAVSAVAYRRALRVAAVSEGVRDALVVDLADRGVAPEDLVVIPNPIDADEVRRLSQPMAARSGRLRFCSVGRLVSAKGFDVLVEALSLARLGSSWELFIVGDGATRASLEALVTHRGLGDHVRFLGWMDNPWPVMASADVAIAASRWEGFGMAAAEGMALGLPQIGSDCPGGLGDLLGHGEYGVVVPPDDPLRLADALSLLADDACLRRELGERALERANDYAPARVAERILDLSEEVRDEACSRSGWRWRC